MSSIIFLFSLPRAGSTWLQRVLASNQAIMTSPESWLLLPLFEVVAHGRALTEYNQHLAKVGMDGFFSKTGLDREAFIQELAASYGRLYERAIGIDSRYFLEKTPRNYLVIEDIVRCFPEAKFIFLWRDPADIGLSLARSYGGKWNSLFRYEIDFAKGVPNLAVARKSLGPRAVDVAYEDLVADPQKALKPVYEYLGMKAGGFTESVLGRSRSDGVLGDQTYKAPRKAQLLSRSMRRTLVKMLESLEGADVEAMGYRLSVSIEKVQQQPVSLFEPRDLMTPFLKWAYRHQLAPDLHRLRGEQTPYPRFGVE
jgi:hypothetical protein